MHLQNLIWVYLNTGSVDYQKIQRILTNIFWGLRNKKKIFFCNELLTSGTEFNPFAKTR